MAGAKSSKNNPTNRSEKPKGKFVVSNDCINCSQQCEKGKAYIQKLSLKKLGFGVWCQK